MADTSSFKYASASSGTTTVNDDLYQHGFFTVQCPKCSHEGHVDIQWHDWVRIECQICKSVLVRNDNG